MTSSQTMELAVGLISRKKVQFGSCSVFTVYRVQQLQLLKTADRPTLQAVTTRHSASSQDGKFSGFGCSVP